MPFEVHTFVTVPQVSSWKPCTGLVVVLRHQLHRQRMMSAPHLASSTTRTSSFLRPNEQSTLVKTFPPNRVSLCCTVLHHEYVQFGVQHLVKLIGNRNVPINRFSPGWAVFAGHKVIFCSYLTSSPVSNSTSTQFVFPSNPDIYPPRQKSSYGTATTGRVDRESHIVGG